MKKMLISIIKEVQLNYIKKHTITTWLMLLAMNWKEIVFLLEQLLQIFKVSDISKYQEPYHFDVVADLLKSNMLLY